MKRNKGLMIKICCFCKTFLGVAPAAPACAGAISHGLCSSCAKKHYGEFYVEEKQ